MSINDKINDFYNKGNENSRLKNDYFGKLEFLRTLDILERYLPKKELIILDVGGGSGVYSFPLTEKGHKVHLIDPIILHLDQAKDIEKKLNLNLESIELGIAENINREDDFADIILLFGPLYHLQNEKDRLKALKEAYRVLKKGGLVFTVGISKYASLMDGLDSGFITDPDFQKIINQDLLNGCHNNSENKQGYFTTAFFHHPDQIKEEMTATGFEDIEMLSVEGLGLFMNDDIQNELNDDLFDTILNYLRILEKEKTLIGIGAHIMGIGRKKF